MATRPAFLSCPVLVVVGLLVLCSSCSTPHVSAPIILPGDGTFTTPLTVEIQCATEGATVVYNFGSSPPTPDLGYRYSTPIPVACTTQVNAMAYKSDMADSPVTTATFTISVPSDQVAAPRILPGSCLVYGAETVTLHCATAGADVHYTTDGSTPSSVNGTRFSGSGIPVNADGTTIRAIATKAGMTDSFVSSATYAVVDGRVVVDIAPAGIVYPETQTVTITPTPSDATVMYTLDGTEPSRTHGYAYTYGSGGFLKTETGTVKALGYKSGWLDSDIVDASYIILWWVASCNDGGIYISMDGGRTWWHQTASSLGSLHHIATDGVNGWLAYRDSWDPSTVTDVYSSTDRGDSWAHTSLNATYFADVASDRAGTWVAAGFEGQMGSPTAWFLRYSDDIGATWNDPTSIPSGISSLTAVAADGYRSWVAVGQGATAVYTDAWADGTWHTGTGLSGNLFDVATNGLGTWVAVGATTDASEGRAFYSSDTGATWTAASIPQCEQLWDVASDGAGTFVIAGGGSNNAPVILRSTDSGRTFAAASHPLVSPSERLSDLRYDRYGTWIAVGENRTILRSTDDGATWTASSVAPSSGGNAEDELSSVAFGRWDHR